MVCSSPASCCTVTYKLCPVGVDSQVVPSLAGTSKAFAPSSAPGCPNPPALAASAPFAHSLLFVHLSQRHIPTAKKTTGLVGSTALPEVCFLHNCAVSTREASCASAAIPNTHCPGAMPAAPQTPGSTQGARCGDAGWLHLSPFSAEAGHKQHFTASGHVIYTKALAG